MARPETSHLGSSLGVSLAVHGAALATLVLAFETAFAPAGSPARGERVISAHFADPVEKRFEPENEADVRAARDDAAEEVPTFMELLVFEESPAITPFDEPFDDDNGAKRATVSDARLVESFVTNELVLQTPLPSPTGRSRRRDTPVHERAQEPGDESASPGPSPSAPRESSGPVWRPNSDPVPLEGACEPPAYPSRAAKRGWTGTVYVWIDVATDGTVSDARIDRSSGHTILDRAAVRAVRGWRFSPAIRDGVPTAMTVRKPIEFKLNS